MSEQFPNITSWHPDVTDSIVFDTMSMLTQHWGYLDHHSRKQGNPRGVIRLSDAWVVRETDDDVDGADYLFEYYGKPLFEMGCWQGKITSRHDTNEVFRKQLRNLIMSAVINVPKNYW